MKLLVISSAPIIIKENKFYMYSPYQKEMEIWAKHADEIQFCCPIWKNDRGLLIDEIQFNTQSIISLKEFDVNKIHKLPKALLFSIINFIILFKAIYRVDHVHLRCPGNIGLIAIFVQFFFPFKTKTTKYAGNWDPNAKQPWSYKLQKYLLSNTFLTKNMQVLVYGKWKNQTKNIKPFFTATYSDLEIESYKSIVKSSSLIKDNKIKFIFVGTLSLGKQPLYAIKIVEFLFKKGINVDLNIYGDGVLRNELESYIYSNKLEGIVFFNGNQSKNIISEAYQNSHFLILPSKSEGWPKVVAEAMVWGCVPIVSPVSCVPYMLDNGKRGLLLKGKEDEDFNLIFNFINSENYNEISKNAQGWSRQFTTNKFETEIKKLLIS